MMPGEMYADFAAGLRDLVGRNKASERVLLAQFYRCLVKTTQKLVKQGKEPRTLEEAVDCPTEIDDPMDNVAQGMRNTGQPWATAPSPYLVPMAGMTGQTAVIPGIGGPGLPADVMALATGGTTTAEPLQNTIALFTNPQVVSRNDDHWSDGESPDTATTSPGEDGVVAELRAARKLEKN
ncbi:hypothetical protein PC113_g6005 [Phytophthora cactorum]|uniref:Uncharacterized protein n=1 Tax=Phytophthora cactorum TaxID=29920 RepID=A0A8T0ZKD1_9STRA|nr:hypothetical protein PC113_g6005 [Phytophthora cactorum]